MKYGTGTTSQFIHHSLHFSFARTVIICYFLLEIIIRLNSLKIEQNSKNRIY